VAVISGDTRYNEKVVKHATGADRIIHEVAIVRSGLMSDAHVRRIMAHHTTAREAGMVFDGAKPKLVAFTRLVLLSSPQAPGHRSQNS
jgi:ribonuclease Z